MDLPGLVESSTCTRSKPKVLYMRRNEVDHGHDFVLHLLGEAVNVSVILRERPHPEKTLQHAGHLVPMDETEFGQTQRQSR